MRQTLAVVPYLMAGATDSRQYLTEGLSTNGAFRFRPAWYSRAAKDSARVHGVDERLSVDGFKRSLHFYARVLELLCQPAA